QEEVDVELRFGSKQPHKAFPQPGIQAPVDRTHVIPRVIRAVVDKLRAGTVGAPQCRAGAGRDQASRGVQMQALQELNDEGLVQGRDVYGLMCVNSARTMASARMWATSASKFKMILCCKAGMATAWRSSKATLYLPSSRALTLPPRIILWAALGLAP